jgi:predicted nucleic acid-binding protein
MSDVVVVDASLALKWVLIEEDSDIAKMLLSRWIDEGKEIRAPALLAYEVTNIIYRQVFANKSTYEEANQELTDLFSVGIVFTFSLYENISTQAMKLAHRFNLPAAYDAHYLALAERENCEYWTADTRLWNSVKNKLSWVHWLGDYQP